MFYILKIWGSLSLVSLFVFSCNDSKHFFTFRAALNRCKILRFFHYFVILRWWIKRCWKTLLWWSIKASFSRQPHRDIIFNFFILCIKIPSLWTFPVEIARYISPISRLFTEFERAFGSTSQTGFEYMFWRLIILIVFWSRSSIVHEDIRISTATIALVEICCSVFRRRWTFPVNRAIVTIKMHSVMS